MRQKIERLSKEGWSWEMDYRMAQQKKEKNLVDH
jgi:hypothetical protein